MKHRGRRKPARVTRNAAELVTTEPPPVPPHGSLRTNPLIPFKELPEEIQARQERSARAYGKD